ncbi:MAG: proline--tRNA ligase, partial [Candidatus Pacebacteria bacterium CG10_big_fil_rev_8_21_14_0_10_56_10]
ASGGDFTDNYSHEFQTRCESGEDEVFYAAQSEVAFNKEIAPSQAPEFDQSGEQPAERREVEGEGIVGAEALAKHLDIPIEKTTKTILFEADDGRLIAAAVRGEYDINEEKLRKVAGCSGLRLASAERVKQVTGAEVGYAGIIGLPDEVAVYLDDSLAGRVNFESGANRTNYHIINVNFGRDLPEPSRFYDIKMALAGDYFPETSEQYEVFRAAEVGNIFPLYTKFSDAFGYTFTDQQGKQQPVYMGSYGIGTSRVMGVLVEKFHDEHGIIWPEQVAPFKVQLVSLAGGESLAEWLHDQLQANQVEVLWDDRQLGAGEKLADADLIGCPIRLVTSAKNGNQVELKRRDEAEAQLLAHHRVCAAVS